MNIKKYKPQNRWLVFGLLQFTAIFEILVFLVLKFENWRGELSDGQVRIALIYSFFILPIFFGIIIFFEIRKAPNRAFIFSRRKSRFFKSSKTQKTEEVLRTLSEAGFRSVSNPSETEENIISVTADPQIIGKSFAGAMETTDNVLIKLIKEKYQNNDIHILTVEPTRLIPLFDLKGKFHLLSDKVVKELGLSDEFFPFG